VAAAIAAARRNHWPRTDSPSAVLA
jgi:hypothetical protein